MERRQPGPRLDAIRSPGSLIADPIAAGIRAYLTAEQKSKVDAWLAKNGKNAICSKGSTEVLVHDYLHSPVPHLLRPGSSQRQHRVSLRPHSLRRTERAQMAVPGVRHEQVRAHQQQDRRHPGFLHRRCDSGRPSGRTTWCSSAQIAEESEDDKVGRGGGSPATSSRSNMNLTGRSKTRWRDREPRPALPAGESSLGRDDDAARSIHVDLVLLALSLSRIGRASIWWSPCVPVSRLEHRWPAPTPIAGLRQ